MGFEVTDTVTLLGVHRKVQPEQMVFSQMFFPYEIVFETEEVAFDVVESDRKLSVFVAPMVSGKPQKERGGVLKRLKPAYVKETDTVNPNRPFKRQAGEALGGSLSPAQRRQAAKAQFMQDAEMRIRRLVEWMAVNLVLTGKVLIQGEDYDPVEVDYGRNPANNIQYIGAAAWSNVDAANYDPTDDIEDAAEKASGVTDKLIFDKKGWRKFASFGGVKEKLDTLRGSTSQMELGPTGKAVWTFKGWFGNFQCWVYTGEYEDAEGNTQKYLPDNTMILAPPSYGGVVGYGAIQDAKANDEGVVAAARWPSNWFTDNPSVEWIQLQTAPLLMMPDPDAFVVVTVN